MRVVVDFGYFDVAVDDSVVVVVAVGEASAAAAVVLRLAQNQIY